jgi:hypothetical protein
MSSFAVPESFLLLSCSDFPGMPKTIVLGPVPSLFHQYVFDLLSM